MKNKGMAFSLLLALLLLTACGKSAFGVSENTGKRMTITANRADKGAFFMVGSLEVSEGEQLVISSGLTKGSVRVEIVGAPETQSVEELPAMDGEAILTADVKSGDRVSGTLPAGSYLLRAVCLERVSGTVQIEVEPAAFAEYMGKRYTGEDPWGNPLSITLKGLKGDEASFSYEAQIGEGEYLRTFLAETSGEMKDGVIAFHVAAAAKENEAMRCDYSGFLTLKDGSLFVTYEAGAVAEESPEGGSAAYQVPGLEGEEKTVELTAK